MDSQARGLHWSASAIQELHSPLFFPHYLYFMRVFHMNAKSQFLEHPPFSFDDVILDGHVPLVDQHGRHPKQFPFKKN